MKQQIITHKKPKATDAEETKEDKKEQVYVASRAREITRRFKNKSDVLFLDYRLNVFKVSFVFTSGQSDTENH